MREFVRCCCLIALLLWGPACGDEAAPEAPAAAEPGVTEPEAPEEEISPYDNSGELRESDVVVAGLPMPMGIELQYEQDRKHVYVSELPIGHLRSYFGRRLVTGQIDESGLGAVYRNAVPREARGGVVALDLSLFPSGRDRTRIEVRELHPAPDVLPNESEIRQRIEDVAARWD